MTRELILNIGGNPPKNLKKNPKNNNIPVLLNTKLVGGEGLLFCFSVVFLGKIDQGNIERKEIEVSLHENFMIASPLKFHQ